MKLLVGVGHWGLRGGSERYALETVEALARRGHELVLLHGEGDSPVPEGVVALRFPALGPLTAPNGDRSRLRELLREQTADGILQLTPCAPWIVEEYLAAGPYFRFVQDHTLFCPSLDKMHSNSEPCRQTLGARCLTRHWLGPGCQGLRASHPRYSLLGPARALRARRYELRLHARADLLLVASEYMRRQLLAAGLPQQRIVKLPYATHAASSRTRPEPLPEVTRDFLARGDAPLLVASARLASPHKGVEYLLTALTKVSRPYRAVIAGEGPAAAWLKRKCREENLSRHVHFSGWLSAGQVESLLEEAELAAFPSVWDEPFGLAGIEAMAHGIPVVAFDVGGVREWLRQGVGGRRVPARDVDAMAEVLSELLGSPALRAELGLAGAARVQAEFRPSRHYEQLERTLQECLAQRAPAHHRAPDSAQGKTPSATQTEAPRAARAAWSRGRSTLSLHHLGQKF